MVDVKYVGSSMIGRKLFRIMCQFWWGTAPRTACQNLSKIYGMVSNYEIVMACSWQHSNQNRDKELTISLKLNYIYHEVTSFLGCKMLPSGDNGFRFLSAIFAVKCNWSGCAWHRNPPCWPEMFWIPDFLGAHHSKFQHFCVWPQPLGHHSWRWMKTLKVLSQVE